MSELSELEVLIIGDFDEAVMNNDDTTTTRDDDKNVIFNFSQLILEASAREKKRKKVSANWRF